MARHIWEACVSLALGCVPLPLRAHAACIKIGWQHYFLAEQLDALLSHVRFPLGSSVKCTLRKQQDSLGVVSALLSNLLNPIVEKALGIFPDVTEPQEVDVDMWKYLFCMLTFCNEVASVRNSSFRILPQYWRWRHGQQILRSIKIKFRCGDLRKQKLAQMFERKIELACLELCGRQRW